MMMGLSSTPRRVRAYQWLGDRVTAGGVVECIMLFGGEGGTIKMDSRTGEAIGVMVRTTRGEVMMRPGDFLVELAHRLVAVMSPTEVFCLFVPDTSWSSFGTHAGRSDAALEFSAALGEDGLPLWERPAPGLEALEGI